MKLCNINVNGNIHLGLVTDNGVFDATAAGFTLTMDELFSPENHSAFALLKQLAAGSTEYVEAPVYANVVNSTGKLICVGLNYRAHAEGCGDALPEVPLLFSKFANALAPAGSQVMLPRWEETYDYEAELVIVVGRQAWNVTEDEAGDYIFGYTCGNDLSCRAAQKRTSQWLIGKSLPGFGPCGPYIVTADSLNPEDGIKVQSYVNGELRQDGNTGDMIFNVRRILSYASRYIRLEPGDLIFTGTPSGVMLEKSAEEQHWLTPGDRVEVVIEGIGTLTNYMV